MSTNSISNVNIYIKYTHPTDTNITKTIYDIKDGKVINDHYEKPFGWSATKIIEFDSNFAGKIKEKVDTKWNFILFSGYDSCECCFDCVVGHNIIEMCQESVGEKDGVLRKKSTIPKLRCEILYVDDNDINNMLFSYLINFRITKQDS